MAYSLHCPQCPATPARPLSPTRSRHGPPSTSGLVHDQQALISKKQRDRTLENVRSHTGRTWWPTSWSGAVPECQESAPPLSCMVMVSSTAALQIGEGVHCCCGQHDWCSMTNSAQPYTHGLLTLYHPSSDGERCWTEKLSSVISTPLTELDPVYPHPKHHTFPVIHGTPADPHSTFSGGPQYQAVLVTHGTSTDPEDTMGARHGTSTDVHTTSDSLYQASPVIQRTSTGPEDMTNPRYKAVKTTHPLSTTLKPAVGLEHQSVSGVLKRRTDPQDTVVSQPEEVTGQTTCQGEDGGGNVVMSETEWWVPRAGDNVSLDEGYRCACCHLHPGHTVLVDASVRSPAHTLDTTHQSQNATSSGGEGGGVRESSVEWNPPSTREEEPELPCVSSSSTHHLINPSFGAVTEAVAGNNTYGPMITYPQYLTSSHDNQRPGIEEELSHYRLLLRLHQTASTINTLIMKKVMSL